MSSGPVPVLYDSEGILGVAKPEGVAAIRERTGASPHLQEVLAAQLGCRIYVVHRLDKDVSGVMLFARTPEAHRLLSLQFERREIEKEYLALVLGEVRGEEGLIDTPLREFGSGRVAADPVRGRPSETAFTVLERIRGWTLLRVRPRTGRRHQIRAHLYSRGHPIAGDRLYGDGRNREGIARLMLHASSIAFRDGDRGVITVKAPCPESFDHIVRAARTRRPAHEPV